MRPVPCVCVFQPARETRRREPRVLVTEPGVGYHFEIDELDVHFQATP